MPLQIRGPLGNTLITSHIKVTARPCPPGINRTAHVVAVQSRTPAVIKSRHAPAAPPVYLDEPVGHAGIGNKHHLQTATTGFTACTAYLGIRQGCRFDSHVASILIKQSSLCYWNKHDWARAFAEQPFLRKFRQGAIQQAVSVAAQNEQVNIESLGFVEQGSDDRAFNQQRRGINMLFPQGLREMVQKLVFMVKLPGHLAA
jgi:hypothetical protein